MFVFGTASLDLLAWRRSTDEFHILDLVPRDVIRTVPSSWGSRWRPWWAVWDGCSRRSR